MFDKDAVTPPPVPFVPPVQFVAETYTRVGTLTRDAVLQMFEQAAVNAEHAGEALMQMAIERVAETKETAKTLRELGALQAASIDRAAELTKNFAAALKAEQAKVTAFRNEAPHE